MRLNFLAVYVNFTVGHLPVMVRTKIIDYVIFDIFVAGNIPGANTAFLIVFNLPASITILT
jgi:hypothetical protein